MIHILNFIVSLAFTWITYFIYNARIMKYERFTEYVFSFIRRFLFYSAFVFIFPLLFFDVIELQHHQYLEDDNYSKLIKQIDQLPNYQRESISAYLNNEFSLQYKIIFLIPLLFVAKELQEIYYKDLEESQIAQIGLSSNAPPPPLVLQPKLISEYVPQKNEEILQIESFYRNQNQFEQIKLNDEVKNSNSKSNQTDLINKLQFTIDGKQNKICLSEYSNKQLAKARHLGRVPEQDSEPRSFNPARTQTVKDLYFTQDTENTQIKIDNLINTKINLILIEISIQKLSFGYLVGVQESFKIAILIIALSSLLEIILFSDWMLFISRPLMGTYLMLFYILFLISMFIGIYAQEILIKVCYCLLIMYCLKSVKNLIESQTMKSVLVKSGISLFILLTIELLFYLK